MRKLAFVFLFILLLNSLLLGGYVRGNIIYEGTRVGATMVLVTDGLGDFEEVYYTTLMSLGPWQIDTTFTDGTDYYAVGVMITGLNPVPGDPAGMAPSSPFRTTGGVATGIDITLIESGEFSGTITYSGSFDNVFLNLYNAYGVLLGGLPELETVFPVDGSNYVFTDVPSGPKMAQVFVDDNGNNRWDEGEVNVWFENEETGALFFVGGGHTFDNIDFSLTNIAENNIPTTFELSSPYPNPFNSIVNFSCNLQTNAHISYTIYNTTGQIIDKIDLGILPKGKHNIDYSPSEISSGLYFAKFHIDNYKITRSFLYLK